ncbi:hypothetical protein HMPREF2743_00285 [Corynebacterium sp. HMSC036D02]|nr:hypothetical protein HMPREF2743_00285 [Corynebacterium sp. HMSC036D02]
MARFPKLPSDFECCVDMIDYAADSPDAFRGAQLTFNLIDCLMHKLRICRASVPVSDANSAEEFRCFEAMA